jgi:16S rRNA (guanine527-N7)-methyltransferase
MNIKHLESITYNIDTFLTAAHLPPLDSATSAKFADYLAVILRWNARMNLTAVRDPGGILQRHFLESIACARLLPRETTTLLDFGSGAGFPGIPIALCRSEIAVTLAESQGKKAAFLQEAVRTLGLNVQIHAGRAEALSSQFDCVTLRAVDRMELAVQEAARLVRIGGWLAPLTTSTALSKIQAAADAGFSWSAPASLPGADDRILALATRLSSPA